MGSIQPASEIKLLSVPDMGYLVTDTEPRGEVGAGARTHAHAGPLVLYWHPRHHIDLYWVL